MGCAGHAPVRRPWSLRKIRLRGPPLPEIDHGLRGKLGFVGAVALVVGDAQRERVGVYILPVPGAP